MNSHDMVFLQNDGISSNEYNINSLFLKGLLEVPYDTSENIKKSASMIKNSIYERMVERFTVPKEIEPDIEPVDELEDELEDETVEELIGDSEPTEEPTEEPVEVKENQSREKKTRKFRNKRVETKKLKPCTKNLN